jgi:OOP family OmpA-OmpF porin
MRILITGSLVFLLWAVFASWFYVCKIKPYCESPGVPVTATDTIANVPSAPAVVEAPKPEMLILYFDYNKSDVKPTSQSDQQSLLFQDWLAKHPEAILYITGHTDSKGSDSYNQTLGTKRAETTMKYFTGKGISPEKIKTSSSGEAKPVSDNETDAGRSKNRRAEITLK